MRKFYGFGLLMLLSSMFFGVMTVAQTVTVDNIEYYCYYNNGRADLQNGKSATGDVVIPAEVEYNGRKYRVTTISYGAFWNNTAITSVNIPASVSEIGSSVFDGCTSLTSITSNADTFEKIGDYPFDKTPWFDNLPAEGGLKYWKKWVIGTDLPDEAEDVHIKEGTIGMSIKSGSIRGKTLYMPKSLSKLDNTLDIRVEKMIVDTKNPTLFSDSSGAVYKKDGESMLYFDPRNGGYIYVKGQILYRMPTNSQANTYKVAEGTKALERCAGWGNNYESIIVPEGCEAVILQCFRDQKRCKYIELPSTVNHFCLYYPGGASQLEVVLKAKKVPHTETGTFGFKGCKHVTLYVPKESLDKYLADPNYNGKFKEIKAIPDDAPLKGDVNGDGKVNAADVTTVYNYIANPEATGLTLDKVDINGDGNINATDITDLYNIIQVE